MRDINGIEKRTEEDLKTDTGFRHKLDEVLRLEKEIYQEITNNKKPHQIEKGSKTT